MFDNCVPRRQLGSCSVTRPFLSAKGMACETRNKVILATPNNLPSTELSPKNWVSGFTKHTGNYLDLPLAVLIMNV